MVAYLEHANITVPDIDAAIAFLKIVEPQFKLRYDAIAEGGFRWVHIGTDDSYIALEEPHSGGEAKKTRQSYQDRGVNHLAWVVEDFDAVVQRLEAQGYRQGIPVETHPHRKRAYYFDSADLEWEIVEYLSDNPAEKNQYD